MPIAALRRVASVTVVCGLVLGGCGGAKSPTRGALTDALITAGLPRAQASCASNALFAVLKPEERKRLASQGVSGLDASASTKVNSALAACTALGHTG